MSNYIFLALFIFLGGFSSGYMIKSICQNRQDSLKFLTDCQKKEKESQGMSLDFQLPSGISEDAKKHLELYIKLGHIKKFCSSIGYTRDDSLGTIGMMEKLDFEIWYQEKQVINALGSQAWEALKKESNHV